MKTTTTDTMRRDNNATATAFGRLSGAAKAALTRSARRAPGSSKPLDASVAAELAIDFDGLDGWHWIMVPTSKTKSEQVIVRRTALGFVSYRM